MEREDYESDWSHEINYLNCFSSIPYNFSVSEYGEIFKEELKNNFVLIDYDIKEKIVKKIEKETEKIISSYL